MIFTGQFLMKLIMVGGQDIFPLQTPHEAGRSTEINHNFLQVYMRFKNESFPSLFALISTV